jgi:hypothetical protein
MACLASPKKCPVPHYSGHRANSGGHGRVDPPGMLYRLVVCFPRQPGRGNAPIKRASTRVHSVSTATSWVAPAWPLRRGSERFDHPASRAGAEGCGQWGSERGSTFSTDCEAAFLGTKVFNCWKRRSGIDGRQPLISAFPYCGGAIRLWSFAKGEPEYAEPSSAKAGAASTARTANTVAIRRFMVVPFNWVVDEAAPTVGKT